MILEALDHNSAVPLYYQIRKHLLAQVRCGALKPGEMIPSEQELSTHLGVSRMTARHAIKSLCDLGVAYSLRGRGTFVSGIKLEKNFRQVISFTEEMQKRGWRAESRTLSFRIARASAEASKALRIPAKAKVISLRRVRLANSSPMGIEWSCIPLRMCPHLLQVLDPRRSLYDTLAREYGLHIVIADETIEAGLAIAEEARLLEIPRNSPVFLFTRISYLHDGKPAEYVRSTYRADRYKIVNRLTRPRVDWRH